ncbi:MAG: thermonuclease family protein [Planctomycetia bacterium]|nr:thermonuclease family protein [Planctomycetia bacterium]
MLEILIQLVLVTLISPDEMTCKVVGITDGDTIVVLDSEKQQHKIRLEGIDAPEKSQPFGSKSKDALSTLIMGKDVTIRWSKKDRYGRILGDVFVGELHVNLELVKCGMAWHFKEYSSSKSLSNAEAEARNSKSGLWALNNPISPWQFRKDRNIPNENASVKKPTSPNGWSRTSIALVCLLLVATFIGIRLKAKSLFGRIS